MENLQQIDARVEGYVLKRLQRMNRLVSETSRDPRNPQGVRHLFTDVVTALLAGLMSGRRSLRDVEKLSARLGLGRHGAGISDGALSHVLELCDEHHFDAMVIRTVKDMNRRGELSHPGLGQHWASIDGKYSCLDHHCGGLGQKFLSDDAVYWRAGVLRAVLISAPSRPALGQWAMGPVETSETNPEKVKHTGEITNLPHLVGALRDGYGDLVSNFVLDAGLWSKDVFLSMDDQGFGLVCGLKKNKPDLFAEVERVLKIERQRQPPQAETDWESYRNGWIRRRIWRTTALDGWNGWTHLRQAVVVEQTTRERGADGQPTGKEAAELRYFITNTTTGMVNPRQMLALIRQHWSIENDCNWTFDLQFAEDDGAWCTTNKAMFALGVLRMVAYNMLQHLRKAHVQVIAKSGKATPRPWRDLYETVHARLLALGTGLRALLRGTALRQPNSRRAPNASWRPAAA